MAKTIVHHSGVAQLALSQRDGWLAATLWQYGRILGTGRLLQEDVVDNVRYYAVRWTRGGVNVYRVTADVDLLNFDVVHLFAGL